MNTTSSWNQESWSACQQSSTPLQPAQNKSWNSQAPQTWGSQPSQSLEAPTSQQAAFSSFQTTTNASNDQNANPELPPLNFQTLGQNLKEIEWSSQPLKPISSTYTFKPQVSTRPASQIEAFLQKSEITISQPIQPILSLEETNFPQEVLTLLKISGIQNPTAIQSLCWSAALKRQDIIAIACTGSGKTLAYNLPLLLHIKDQQEKPTCLVLSPTRELARQIHYETGKYCKALDLKSVCLYGGNGRQFQIKDLEVNPELLIGTPGRILDFLQNEVISLKSVSYVVVDQSDKMLEMGFQHQLTRILSQIRPDKQLIMCSATWSSTLQQLADTFSKSPIFIRIGAKDLTVNPNIKQIVKVIPGQSKRDTLFKDIQSLPEKRVLVFVDTKAECQNLFDLLEEAGIASKVMNGDKSQSERQAALLEFRAGRCMVLISTDLASRGIDVKDLDHVITYDFPRRIQDYIHRIGRTGRAGTTGTAITYFTEQNSKQAQGLIDLLRESKNKVPRELIGLVRKKRDDEGGVRNRSRSPRG